MMYNNPCTPQPVPVHTNGFIDLNNNPFLLGEYLDREAFRAIDRSVIYSSIDIDTTEAMRAIVSINIDDIGKRPGNLPRIQGNTTKYRQLLEMIHRNYVKLDHQLPVIKGGIRLCIHYQLENNNTGQMIRSAQENIIIKDRQYFIDVNPREINDNAIITNFSQSCVSTLTNFTHGRDPMQLRITHIQMYYDVVSAEPVKPVPEQMVGPMPTAPANNSMYDYYSRNQNRQFIGDCECDCNNDIYPPHWDMYNRLYHFDNNGRDITLHMDEINNPRSNIIPIPCGCISVNRVFFINPGHRIVWKFCIWKNDVTVVNDTRKIAEALKAPCYPPVPPVPPPPKPSPMDYAQNAAIRELLVAVNQLSKSVDELKNGTIPPNGDTPTDETPTDSVPATPLEPATPDDSSVPVVPLQPATPTNPGCDCNGHPCHPYPPPYPPRPPYYPPPPPPGPNPIPYLFHEIRDIKSDINDINQDIVENTINPIPYDDVDNIMNDAIQNVPDYDDTLPIT